jgi:hypothetical protein
VSEGSKDFQWFQEAGFDSQRGKTSIEHERKVEKRTGEETLWMKRKRYRRSEWAETVFKGRRTIVHYLLDVTKSRLFPT